MHKLSLVIIIYNEAKRLKKFLKSHNFADHIYVAIKKSNDNSRDIAKKFKNVSIIDLPFSNPSEEFLNFKKDFLENITSDWIFILTAADTVDRTLYEKIKKITNKTKKEIISVPFKNYIFGISPSFSPWPSLCYKKLVCKLKISDFKPILHNELQFTSNKHLKISSKYGHVHHYSNINDEDFLNKSMTYAKITLDQSVDLNSHPFVKSPFYSLFKILFNGLLRRKTIFNKDTGPLLGVSYIYCHILIMFLLLYKFKIKKNKT